MEPNYKPAARASQTLGEDCYDGSGGKQRTSDRHQSGPAAGRTRANVWVKIQLEPVAKQLPTPTKEPCATNVFFQRAGTATRNLDVDQTLKWPDGTAAERKGTLAQVRRQRRRAHACLCTCERVPLCASCLKVTPPPHQPRL